MQSSLETEQKFVGILFRRSNFIIMNKNLNILRHLTLKIYCHVETTIDPCPEKLTHGSGLANPRTSEYRAPIGSIQDCPYRRGEQRRVSFSSSSSSDDASSTKGVDG